MLHPKLFVIFSTFLEFAYKNELPVVVTSIHSDRKGVISKSRTHEEFRAIDVSTKGWSEEKIKEVAILINTKHKDIAAISASDLVPRAILFHNSGHGHHGHIQCKR